MSPENSSEEVALFLYRKIKDGILTPGSRLPTEKELCLFFDVSRSGVREAIAMLKFDGLVETHRGSGAYVSSNATSCSFRFDTKEKKSSKEGLVNSIELAKIFELRLLIECSAAELAAARRRTSDLWRMRYCLDRLSEEISEGKVGVGPDADFHQAIAKATYNEHLVRLIDFVSANIESSISLARESSAKDPERRIKVQEQHEAIYLAIEQGDPRQASAAVRRHLFSAANRLGVPLKDIPSPGDHCLDEDQHRLDINTLTPSLQSPTSLGPKDTIKGEKYKSQYNMNPS